MKGRKPRDEAAAEMLFRCATGDHFLKISTFGGYGRQTKLHVYTPFGTFVVLLG